MAKTPEGKVKDKIKSLVKAHNLVYSMKVPMGYGASGWPDFDIVAWGVFLTIEAKADASKRGPTALQVRTMRDIKRAGGVPLVVDASNLDALGSFLKACSTEHRDLGYLVPQRAAYFAEHFNLIQA